MPDVGDRHADPDHPRAVLRQAGTRDGAAAGAAGGTFGRRRAGAGSGARGRRASDRAAGERGDHSGMSEIIYHGKVVTLRLDTVELGDGRTVRLEIVEHAPSIGVLALKDERTALLVRQYRHSAGETLLEIVAGSLDPEEAPDVAAQRELAEETGFRARDMIRLGGFYLCPGYTTEF